MQPTNNEVNETNKTVNEKKKWQIALRRYIINKSKSNFYAPYFGIDIEGFRSWIELQFDPSLNWDNFSKAWQLEHVLPVSFFNLDDQADLRLCWNFLNIKIEKLHIGAKPSRLDLQTVSRYFEELYNRTNVETCRLYIDKVQSLQAQKLLPLQAQIEFLISKSADIAAFQTFSSYEFDRLNSGDSVKNLLDEQELMRRFS